MAQRVDIFRLPGPEAASCNLPSDGKEHPLSVKKTPLRDLQNENNVIVSKSSGSSILTKEGEVSKDGAIVSGSKRPCVDPQVHSSQHQSPSSNRHLVYVRRKSEIETSKSHTDEAVVENKNNGDCSKQRQIASQQVTIPENSFVHESQAPCMPAFAPLPTASSMNFSSGKPSVPLPLGKPVTRPLPTESHSHPGSSYVSTSDRKKMNHQNWEERYFQLQMYLKNLDQSTLEDYVEKLRALSPAELNKYAIEQEKRTIQLSLEEGVEQQRVRALDVLGKSRNVVKVSPVLQELLQTRE